MDIIEKSIDEDNSLSNYEKETITQMYLKTINNPDSSKLEENFDKILENIENDP